MNRRRWPVQVAVFSAVMAVAGMGPLAAQEGPRLKNRTLAVTLSEAATTEEPALRLSLPPAPEPQLAAIIVPSGAGPRVLDRMPAGGGVQSQFADPAQPVERIIVRQEMLHELRRAVAELPPRQRAAVLMHKYEEMELSQIAVSLGCTLPTVKSRLFRAYATLRVRLSHLAAG